ncbi:TniB NTP-binding protein [Georgfuchsia toluolica]|uniref:TniB NTP-binding protein n=1 Tax=Georgfuchsia toluolica TaxID=424218 RepID=A0A916J7T6_9PROT|nr:TniB NTP-binding protein [Georgfuchsia toluolica]
MRAVKKLLGLVGTRMLLIDEIHDMLIGGAVKQREFRVGIKDLGNELKIPIVAAGIKEAWTVFTTDPQLSNRFQPDHLPLWNCDEEVGKLLASFERRLPLRKPALLKQPELLQKIVWMSEGILGDMHDVLKLASIAVIRSGEERITLAALEKLKWVKPSMRQTPPKLA